MSAIALRKETEADLGWLAELYAETRAAELAPVPWPAEVKRAFLKSQFDAQHAYYLQAYAGAAFLVVEADGRPIGRLYVHRSPGEIRLVDIAILAAERNRGIGTRLVAELIDEARRTNAQLTLHVEPTNPAQRLYARLGFRLIENRGVYHFLGWRASEAPLS